MADNQEQDAPTVHWRINEWFPDLSPEVKSGLKTYHGELIKFNRNLNLISAKTVFVADAIYFADAILSTRTIMTGNPQVTKLHQLGAGSGFPGIVLALMHPAVQVVLLEADKKKCEFLSHITSTLGLNNVTVKNCSIDTLPDGSVQHAVARAFSSISKTVLLCRKVMPKGGALFHLKGEEWGIEVGEIPTQLCSIWSPSLVGEYKLPVGAIKFAVVKTEKIS